MRKRTRKLSTGVYQLEDGGIYILAADWSEVAERGGALLDQPVRLAPVENEEEVGRFEKQAGFKMPAGKRLYRLWGVKNSKNMAKAESVHASSRTHAGAGVLQ